MNPLLILSGILAMGMLVVSRPVDQPALVVARDPYIPGKRWACKIPSSQQTNRRLTTAVKTDQGIPEMPPDWD